MGRNNVSTSVLAALIAWAGIGSAAPPAATDAARHELGEPGFLVIVGAADTTDTFVWQDGPGADRRSLVWNEGVLTVPRGMDFETYGPHDLGVPCGAALAGNGRGGRLVFSEGTFPIDEPVRLTDGVLDFYAASGELEIRPGRVRYLRSASRQKDPRASFIMLAGLVLLTVILLRRARRGPAGDGRR
jgi:hypothetical protein